MSKEPKCYCHCHPESKTCMECWENHSNAEMVNLPEEPKQKACTTHPRSYHGDNIPDDAYCNHCESEKSEYA